MWREPSGPWNVFTEGSSCVDGSGGGLILTNPKGAEFTYALRFRFDTTNNEAEYEALITGLRIAKQMGVKNLQANVDSRLVANQELFLGEDATRAIPNMGFNLVDVEGVWFGFFLQMGFTLILATLDGLDVGLLGDVIGGDDCDDDE
ncbi:reverse transcriptase domain-containing protein [Tanacetum coccineum]|uniref:Reverse transcriptase domain-containing protein n=1 Tax=Tanacetum coccineum TaxID=301880 RepID=A0ABQ5IFV5_9ASTR